MAILKSRIYSRGVSLLAQLQLLLLHAASLVLQIVHRLPQRARLLLLRCQLRAQLRYLCKSRCHKCLFYFNDIEAKFKRDK